MILEEIAKRYDYVMSDLASSLLIEALRNPHLVYYVLREWFELEPDEAKEISREITDYISYLLIPLEGGDDDAWWGREKKKEKA